MEMSLAWPGDRACRDRICFYHLRPNVNHILPKLKIDKFFLGRLRAMRSRGYVVVRTVTRSTYRNH